MDGQSVKTTERGGTRDFDGHKLVRGRKRHILVDTLGLPIASRVEPANVPDQKAGARLLGGLRAFFPAIRIMMADTGHESRKLGRTRNWTSRPMPLLPRTGRQSARRALHDPGKAVWRADLARLLKAASRLDVVTDVLDGTRPMTRIRMAHCRLW
jgi:hypothetical protein